MMKISKQLSKLRNLMQVEPGRSKPPRRRQLRRLLIEQMEDRRLLTTIDLAALTAAQGITIFGADAGDFSGLSVSSAGDVNGDGFDDFLIGAPTAGASGNAKPTAGESYLIFGGPSLPATIDLANLGAAGITIFGADAGDLSGISVSSAGDVNGDGFDDFIIGADRPAAAGNANLKAGESYLIFGGPALPATIDLANLGAAGITIFGADAGDYSGFSVSSAGDVNGDGFDDLVIGARYADASGNTKPSAGESYLIFGAASLPATIDLANLGSAGITIFGADADDRSGRSVSSAGDVNGDGFDDLLIGAPYGDASGNAKSSAGESYLIFGAASLPATIDLANLGSAGITIFGADAGDYSGLSVSSVGDVNGDGFDDFVIGAYYAAASGNAKSAAGESYVIFGAASLPATIDLANLGSAGITIFGADAGDYSGISVSSAGDVNGDGFDDLLIGADRADGAGNAKPTAGESYVIFGAASLPATIDLANLGSAGITIFGAEGGDRSGWPVSSAGDVNGDGFDDFLIGAYGGDAAGNAKANAGDSYLIFGGDFTGSVTHQGTAANDTLTGTAAADVMIGGRGDDILIGNGGADVLRGGEGDDILAISDLSFARLVGGSGFDTLRLDGSGLTLDLTATPNNRIVDIEQIDLTGSGDNTLILTALEVLNLSSTTNTLIVRRNSGDTVDIGSGWTQGDDGTIGDDTFEVFTQGVAVLKIQVASGNLAPTELTLTPNTVEENVPAETTVGTFSTTDPNEDDTFVYTFVSGAGDDDNSSFTISAAELAINVSPDFETKASYSIRVRTIDNGGLWLEKSLNITVTDVNEPPTDIVLSANLVLEKAIPLANAVPIGTLSAIDPDADDTHTFDLINGVGPNDNTFFSITGDELLIKSGTIVDFESKPNYTVHVQVTDSQGETFAKDLLVTVGNRGELEVVTIGDGTAQRSRVTGLTVTFDSEVDIDSDAFTVIKRGAAGGPVDVAFSSTLDGQGRTVASLSFSGALTQSGSLIDGNYELQINGSKITDAFGQLDLDEDGSDGGSYLLGDEATDDFFRLFGDVDGNRSVGFTDFLAFRASFGASLGDANFDDRFDINQDDTVSFQDFLAFRSRFGSTLTFE